MKLTDNIYCYMWTSMYENNCNSYYIGGDLKILFDPGHAFAFDGLQKNMAADGISLDDVDTVVLTHGHPDHFEAAGFFIDSPAKLALGAGEVKFVKQFGAMFGVDIPDIRIDIELVEGDLNIGGETLQIINTPGHSPGSVSIYWPTEKALITGDVIFNQSVGRTDFPGGDSALLKESIVRLSQLDIEYLLPGHMGIIQGKEAVDENFRMVKEFIFDYL
jgi:hydroxyacylglutathione hydrolase